MRNPMIKPILAAAALSLLAACSTGEARGEAPPPAAAPTGTPFTVVEEEAPAYTEARGVARAVLQATLSTKLMGSVLEVPVKEGDRVARGAVLVRIDAADLAARRQQVAAGVAQAQASLEEAATHARRMRALFAEEAAPRAQVDAAEAALARAERGCARRGPAAPSWRPPKGTRPSVPPSRGRWCSAWRIPGRSPRRERRWW
jgi:multidrug efflux pump subunit AcrA (membrane-fusion protein)